MSMGDILNNLTDETKTGFNRCHALGCKTDYSRRIDSCKRCAEIVFVKHSRDKQLLWEWERILSVYNMPLDDRCVVSKLHFEPYVHITAGKNVGTPDTADQGPSHEEIW